jgi:hypothetical protein
MKRTKLLTVVLAAILFAGTANGQAAKPQTKNINNQNSKPNTMENQNYTATIVVDKDGKTAFDNIKNFRGWWSEDITGKTDQVGSVFVYRYKDIHFCKIELVEAVPGKKLVYKVLDNHFSFITDETEWVGTKLVFDISAEEDKTKVKFTHEGLVPQYECYKVCYDAWSNYIKTSLYDLITKGKGEPNPKDKDGFNAELANKWKIN